MLIIKKINNGKYRYGGSGFFDEVLKNIPQVVGNVSKTAGEKLVQKLVNKASSLMSDKISTPTTKHTSESKRILKELTSGTGKARAPLIATPIESLVLKKSSKNGKNV